MMTATHKLIRQRKTKALQFTDAVVWQVSRPRWTSRNWRYQREAQCGYRAIEVITRYALAAGSAGSALGDSLVVQQDPRTGVNIQSDCTSQ